MTWKTMRKRLSALTLAAVLTVTLSVPAVAAEAIGDGVAPTYDEAYYATLDYYGNLLEGSVVKSCAMNGKDCLTDYGVYDEVVNLTDSTAPVSGEGGSTSFRFTDGAPDHFYFEGKTKKPFEDLPWRISLRYTLNGVPAKAEDLAGKQGVVEIFLDIVPNENAGDYARYNYTLAATALFNQDDILSLEAEGAQVQLVGNLRTVLFLCLPGEDRERMLASIRYLNAVEIQGIKLQLLHILKGTDLAAFYGQHPFPVPTLEQYTDLILSCVECLRPDMVIHRLTGDGPGDQLIAPLWTRSKRHVLNTIHQAFRARDTWQGRYYQPPA